MLRSAPITPFYANKCYLEGNNLQRICQLPT
nr:MAG TPA: hypothetical protein [Caudoviricetes sp.]